MSPLDALWTGVLSLLSPLISPDWGNLVALIPWLLLVLGLVFLALMGRAWWRLLASEPDRGPKVRPQNLRPKVVGHIAVIGLGVATALLAFAVGAQQANWTGANSPTGLVVNLPLLILGLGIAVGAAGDAARQWERSSRDDVAPDVIDRAGAAVRRHPGRSRRVVVFVAGVMIAATGMAMGSVPGWNGGAPMPVAFVPVLLLGLAMAIGAAGASVAALWQHDPDLDLDAGDVGSTALLPTKH